MCLGEAVSRLSHLDVAFRDLGNGFSAAALREPLTDRAAIESDFNGSLEWLVRIEIDHWCFHLDLHIAERTGGRESL